MKKTEKYLVCCALPYANGPIHLGHLAGAYLPGDIFTRFKRLQGHDVHFVCGSDEHGVAITFRAVQEKISPQEVVDKYHKIIKDSLIDAGIKFDVFSRTTHPCHIKRTQEIFLNLFDKGLIEKKTEQRLFCNHCTQYLPDRYVVGSCPKCKAAGARGDQCEKCGAWYEPEDLIDPICQICKVTKATLKDTTHWYFSLNKLEPQLRAWLETKTDWRKSVLGYAFQPIKEGLAPRAITRDLDWGVPVPLAEAKDKVIYVWFDAPIGYISASEDWAQQIGKPDKWKDYWQDQDCKLVHFIGKDNIIFHTVVWPGILIADGRYILPQLVAGNEFLNLEGEKFSTSRNYAIWLSDVLKIVDADLIRYYLTSIAPENSDANFTWAEFQIKINTELADIVGNLSNRCLSFIQKNYNSSLEITDFKIDSKITNQINVTTDSYSKFLDQGLTKQALNETINLGRFLNAYFQESAPWKLRKENDLLARQALLNTLVGIKAIAILLSPICPQIASKIWQQLGLGLEIQPKDFDAISQNSFSSPLVIGNKIEPIVTKIEDAWIAEQKLKLSSIK